MLRTRKTCDAYYWLVLTIIFFAIAVCDVVLLLCRGSRDRSALYASVLFLAILLGFCPLFVKTTAGLFREYQLAPSGITEYSVFRRKRAIAWNDYPYAYIIRTRPMFRSPHSCMQFFLFSKSPLPARMKKEKHKYSSYYSKRPKEYIIFGYSEEMEQKIREMRPEITFIKRDLYR